MEIWETLLATVSAVTGILALVRFRKTVFYSVSKNNRYILIYNPSREAVKADDFPKFGLISVYSMKDTRFTIVEKTEQFSDIRIEWQGDINFVHIDFLNPGEGFVIESSTDYPLEITGCIVNGVFKQKLNMKRYLESKLFILIVSLIYPYMYSRELLIKAFNIVYDPASTIFKIRLASAAVNLITIPLFVAAIVLAKQYYFNSIEKLADKYFCIDEE